MSNKELNKIVKFYRKYLGNIETKVIKVYILQHYKYGTFDYAVDEKGEVIGLCRWNISLDGKTAHIIDFAIREDWRNRGVGKRFVERALKIWKDVTHLEFKRGVRGEQKKHIIPIKAILKRDFF